LVGAPQKLGESRAAEFNSIRTDETMANTKPHTALLPVDRAPAIDPDPTTPATRALRLCPQYGQ
jgi:hypothetical protein